MLPTNYIYNIISIPNQIHNRDGNCVNFWALVTDNQNTDQ